MVLLEKFEDRGRALDGEFALALALPKDHAPAAPLGALVSMSHAIRRTGTLVANVSLPYAAWFTSCAVSMLPAALLAGRAVPLFAARMWIIAAMPPGEALNHARITPVSRSTYDQRRPRASPCRMPRERATDHRAPFLLLAATSRMRRASSRVRGSISFGATAGASTRVATFREIRPRRSAIFRARESMRCRHRGTGNGTACPGPRATAP